ncbi:sulfurtransferase TusA family protein [Olsenella sp. HMSC062G07]|uniref:sulfurtransferase TusA family protein n=1 Tax=Olsenella sp. HMSC062G07 TaxID=1739330 RepID=UPI0008A2D65E|nr:sulfurtransferase TusA family protein [Olsenella sp. HMSC062G07]OFK24064.1 hypothetical protein HMPREF2826_03495 [Olsenella sp. HMSC062G07]
MQLDARDLFNPKPLMMAMEALADMRGGQTLTIQVNDGMAVESILRLAEEQGLKFTLEDEGDYSVVQVVSNPQKPFRMDRPIEKAVSLMGFANEQEPVFLFTSDKIGNDDRELGRNLMRDLIHDLATVRTEPQALVFLNSAVQLTTIDEACVEHLGAFSDKVRVMSDRASLERYHLLDQLKVGEVIESFQVAQLLMSRPHVVTL